MNLLIVYTHLHRTYFIYSINYKTFDSTRMYINLHVLYDKKLLIIRKGFLIEKLCSQFCIYIRPSDTIPGLI